ncbi:hypothetical protein BHE74_00028844, partial [Ensete ventricosum]
RMDLDDLRGMPKVSGGKASDARSAASTQAVDGAQPTKDPKSSSKSPSDSPVPPDDPSRRHKKMKILSQRHKSRHGKGGSRSHSKGKEPAEPVEEPETPVDFAEEDASPVFHRLRSMKDLFKTKQEIDTLKSGGGPEAVAAAEKRASELEKELEKTKCDRQLQRVGRLQERPEEGGLSTYEYGYRVALARFRSLHLDSEVEEDPFTIKPEDDSIPMERQQAFDDSDLPKS